MIRHIVIFNYRNDATQSQIDALNKGFWALKDRIPGIIGMEAGVNNSPENLNRGLTHVFQLTFADAGARDAYLPHPEHKAFGDLIGQLGIVNEVFVIDYEPA